ncbi:MAG TPA: aminoglycoside phosphotransferase [Pseudonocardiaceae bacterium]|nr:aminoglycoside phosphotransferase [Pseudonocardiaceae bacterium]
MIGTATDLLTEIADALAVVLPEQRWFAGKGRPVRAVVPVHAIDLAGTNPRLVHAVVEVDQGARHRDRYQLLLGVRGELPETLGHAWVAATGEQVVYQAVHDPELTAVLLELMARGADTGGLRFATEPGVTLDASARSRPVGAEQSNTSLVYGQAYVLKLFRKLTMGANPDLELHRALAKQRCPHIAAPLGSIEWSPGSPAVTYGMLSEFLRNAAEGWAMATASVRDLLAGSSLADGPPESANPAEAGGDFAAEAHRLGHAVAIVHADLATALGVSPAPAGYLEELAEGMHHRLDTTLAAVPALAEHAAAVRAVYNEVRELDVPVPLQRVHGDLHLGQTLRDVTGWVLIDFEGEPLVPLAARIAPASALRDVAGMLRSFDYAAHHLPQESADAERAAAAIAWTTRNQGAFCDGYSQAAPDPRDQAVLLRAFELDKAVYEVGYEHAHRPTWLPIPLAAITRLTT